ncbi:MAG: hemerythrin family protein [Nitrospirae bacterium]|nr:hemerythrin family protein [Nitrospirota bacterium]
MDIQWDSSLTTGVDELDDQHKEIFSRINRLVNMSHPEKEKEIEKIFRFLGGYVMDHFTREEEYMIRYKYPDYDSHKGEHIQFLKNYSSLKKMFDQEGATELIITATQNQAVDWLIKHIRTTDKQMAAYLKSKM